MYRALSGRTLGGVVLERNKDISANIGYFMEGVIF